MEALNYIYSKLKKIPWNLTFIWAILLYNKPFWFGIGTICFWLLFHLFIEIAVDYWNSK